MPRSKEQQEGIDYEIRMGKRIGADVQVGSGNMWFAKLDLAGRGMLWSLKWTSKESFRLTKKVLGEAIREALKDGSVPGLMIEVAGESFTVLRTNDFIMLMEEESKVVEEDKGARRRRRAALPSLLRDREEE